MGGRRIRGEGSVYQRKSGDGRWVGSFIVEETGKRKYVYGATQAEALNKLKAAQREQEQGTLATGKDQTLKDFLIYWLEKVHKPTIYVSSYVRYRTVVNYHLIPGLGGLSLRKLTTQHVQMFIAGKLESGLVPGTVRFVYGVLHMALDHALKMKLVSQNVCSGVTLPKAQKHKSEILAKDQLLKLLDIADAHNMGAFVKLGLMSGMRHGELLALRWADIDFSIGVLSVAHKVVRLPGLGYVEGDPKTEAGTRKILLPQFVIDALETHRGGQQVKRELAGINWKEHNLIFCNQIGRAHV